MPGCFHTLDVTRFRLELADLHTQVANGQGRVEITRNGTPDVCVLISKTELDSLERALEILSRTDDFKAMCQSLTQVASAANGTSVAPA